MSSPFLFVWIAARQARKRSKLDNPCAPAESSALKVAQ
jgi:hypothetical protein